MFGLWNLLADGNGTINITDIELEASVSSDCSERPVESDKEVCQVADDVPSTDAGQSAAPANEPSEETDGCSWPGISKSVYVAC
jgi:hypothetical protein